MNSLNLTPDEINIAELSLLLLQHRAMEDLKTESEEFTKRQQAALREARKRILTRLMDQITFKQRQLNRKAAS